MVQSDPLAPRDSDEAFREIQLNGKQLVFLFMVAAVASVVIFLCGVFVGRGVRAERLADGQTAAPGAVTTPDATAAAAPAPAPAGSDPTTAPPPPAVEDLSYFNRLEGSGQPAEELRTSADAPAAAAPAAKPAASAAREHTPAPRTTPVPSAPAGSRSESASPPPAPAQVLKEAPPAPAAAGLAEPPGQGFALQVTALREREEAESVARRLAAKGYTAYVIAPPSTGTPKYYRVRIGKFRTRREAEDIAAKLQKEEQIKPWITR